MEATRRSVMAAIALAASDNPTIWIITDNFYSFSLPHNGEAYFSLVILQWGIVRVQETDLVLRSFKISSISDVL
jgi:hypothetical protein